MTQHEFDVISDQLQRNRVDLYSGSARFVGPHTVEVCSGDSPRVLEADKILIGPGTRPARPSHIPFDGKHIFDSDELLELDEVPRSMIVVGAGVIGIEYAIMLATLGVQLTVIDGAKESSNSATAKSSTR